MHYVISYKSVFVGGMRHLTESKEYNCDDPKTLNPLVSEALRKYLPNHFPTLDGVSVECEWVGIMGFSTDRNPLIGVMPGRQREYIAAGYTGHGMPVAFLAGKHIADMISRDGSSEALTSYYNSQLLDEPLSVQICLRKLYNPARFLK